MQLSVGIVGLPNVGKSTLFTALTKNQVDAANYPFCTIDPNIGIVTVPDNRLSKLNEIYQAEKVVPTVVEFFDIAGLVSGAHKGEGLGNTFLSHIREVDAICQVVRDFADPDVTHVSGTINPQSDIETINTELLYADLATVDRRINDIEAKAKSGNKELQEQLVVYRKIRALLDKGTILSNASLSEEEQVLIYDLHLLTMKPVLYVLNVDEANADQDKEGFIAISAKIEAELASMGTREAQEYLQSIGLEKTGLDRLIEVAYSALGLITFFTAGPKEVHAWAVERGSTAPQAGAKVHTDFEEKFIRAEIASWQDIVKYEGEAGAKAKGKVRIEGKEYIVQDGDVVYFRI